MDEGRFADGDFDSGLAIMVERNREPSHAVETLMANFVLASAAVTACHDAGLPIHLAHTLVRSTAPKWSGVSVTWWRQAREIFAAELKRHGWTERAIAHVLGVSPSFVRVSYQQQVARFGLQDTLPLDSREAPVWTY